MISASPAFTPCARSIRNTTERTVLAGNVMRRGAPAGGKDSTGIVLPSSNAPATIMGVDLYDLPNPTDNVLSGTLTWSPNLWNRRCRPQPYAR